MARGDTNKARAILVAHRSTEGPQDAFEQSLLICGKAECITSLPFGAKYTALTTA